MSVALVLRQSAEGAGHDDLVNRAVLGAVVVDAGFVQQDLHPGADGALGQLDLVDVLAADGDRPPVAGDLRSGEDVLQQVVAVPRGWSGGVEDALAVDDADASSSPTASMMPEPQMPRAAGRRWS